MDLLITKVIAQLILPPGGIVLVGAVGLWLTRRRARAGKALIGAALVLLWLLATEPVRDLLLAPLEDAYPPFSPVNEDKAAIVVLGGGLEEHSPAFQGADRLSHAALKRAVYGAYLARRIRGPIVVSGGQVIQQTSLPEGEVMRRFLVEMGVDPKRIIVEAKARNTWENARYTAAILRARGVERAIVVTTAWHMPRAMLAFRRIEGIEWIPAPCDYRRDFGEPYDLRSFLPRWTWFADSGDALHEYLGLVWYRLRYGWTG